MYSETTGADPSGAASPRTSSADRSPSARFAPEPADHRRQLAVSPALRPWLPGESPAFEMKFLLDGARAREVERRLARHLAPDPHGDPALGNAYHITTIYCDTPEFEVFRRIGPHRRRKYRLRRYGREPLVFLERKLKRGERVRKRRTTIDDRELPALSEFSTDAGWPGHWFHEQLVRRRLDPVCCLAYLRMAYVGAGDEGPLRLTFDRDIRSRLVNDWSFAPAAADLPVLEGLVVCEFKFRGHLPALFKAVIHELALEPAGVSKYRHGFVAAGGSTNGSGRHD